MIFLVTWWLLLTWTFTTYCPNAFQDWKDFLFYTGGGTLVILKLFRTWRSPSKAIPLNRITLPVLAYLIVAALSLATPWAIGYEGLIALSRLIIWAGIVWYLSQITRDQWWNIAKVSVMSTTLISLSVLAVKIHDWSLISSGVERLRVWGYDFSAMTAFIPPLGHISYFADFMALQIPLAYGLMTRSQTKKDRFLWMGCLFLILLTVWFSVVRSALVATIGGIGFSLILVIFITKKMPWKWMIEIFLLLSLSLGLISLLRSDGLHGQTWPDRLMPFFQKLSMSELDSVSSGRLHLIRTTLKMAQEHPLTGWGLGSFKFSYPPFFSRYDQGKGDVTSSIWLMHPHNETVHQAAEVGFLGMILFYSIFGALFWYGIQKSKISFERSGVREEFLETAIPMVGLIIAITSWQFDTSFPHPLSRLMVALYAGALLRESQFPQLKFALSQWILLLIPVTFFITLGYSLSLFATQQATTSRNPENSLWWSKLAYDLAPGTFDAAYLRNKYLWETENNTEALEATQELYHTYPHVPVVLYVTALAQWKEGHSARATALLEEALAIDPQFANARQLLGVIQRKP